VKKTAIVVEIWLSGKEFEKLENCGERKKIKILRQYEQYVL